MRPGEVLDERFEIERVAGSGGMGVVFRGRDRRTGNAVAIKTRLTNGAVETERLMREATVLAELRHPAIVGFVAHGKAADGEIYVVMEWIDGETLEARLARRPLTAAESLVLVARVAEAVGVAHAQGIVHRDLKPGNLLLRDGRLDRVTVLDFGAAWIAVGAEPPVTAVGAAVGTPGYMAPEQARGDRVIDARADVFALGCVLFECLAGRPAFLARNAMALFARILLEETPHIRELRPEVGPELDALVARMMSKDAADRPSDARAVAAEIEALADVHQHAPTEAAEQRERGRGGTSPGASESGSSITESEQRLLCVIVVPNDSAASPGGGAQEAVGGSTVRQPAAPSLLGDIGRVSSAHGGRAVVLADGSAIVTLAGTGMATDLAERAARCALALREAVPDIPLVLATGRGELSGRWPVGPVIDRAASLVAEAPTGERIHVDDVTAALIETRFEIGGTPGGGRLLLGEREAQSAVRTVAGRSTPFVGRDAELAMLDAIVAQSVSESVARSALVVAPPGYGKSRLADELVRRLRERDSAVRVISARADPVAAGAVFGIVGQLVRRGAGVLAGEAPDDARRKLRARVTPGANRVAGPAAGEAEHEHTVAFLAELIGVGGAAEPSARLRAARHDPRLMGERMSDAFRAWLASECDQAAGVVLLIDDLHWGDLSSVRFLDGALETLSDRSLVVVALARPEVEDVFPRLFAERGAQQIRLAGLSPRAASRFVTEVLGPRVADETTQRILGLADGNAFFLEELVRTVASGRVDTLPETLVAMVQSRIEALDGEQRRVLRAASVFGETFWEGGVRLLLGDDGASGLRDRLDELETLDLVERRDERFPAQAEYGFRHALLRDAAYGMLTDADRAAAHALAGEWLERAGEPDARVLASHFHRGGQPLRALPWYRRAAAQALEGNDLPSSIDLAARAVACGAAGRALGELRAMTAQACAWLGDWRNASDHGLEALDLLERGVPAWHLAASIVVLASNLTGNWTGFLQVMTALRREGLRGEVDTPRAIASYLLAMSLLIAGQRDAAQEHLSSLLADDGSVRPTDIGARGWLDLTRGLVAELVELNLGRALAYLREAMRCFEEAGDLRGTCAAAQLHGVHLTAAGAYDEAEQVLRSALAIAEQRQLWLNVAFMRCHLGLLFRQQGGRTDEAARLAASGISLFEAEGNLFGLGAARSIAAAIDIERGLFDRAIAHGRAGEELLVAAPPARVGNLTWLARALLASGRADEALASAREAAQLTDHAGTWIYSESAMRLVLAEALHAVGDEPGARAAIVRARERVHERAATLPEEMRAAFLERVRENARALELAAAWVATEPRPAG